MADEVKTFEYLLEYIWAPVVAWLIAANSRTKQDNKERDEHLQALRERAAVAEARYITREEVVLIIEGRIANLEDKVDKIGESLLDIAKNMPRRNGD